MTGQALIVQGDALHLPLPDASVDLIVTSPPFWALRAYGAGPGEIGSEPTPQQFLEALWAATAEMMRVLKPSGSIFVDLGDKYSGNETGGAYSASGSTLNNPANVWKQQTRRTPARTGLRPKSLLLLPERYRVGCVDHLGLIARAVIVWDKPNGLPESVTDRVRRSHEDWVHLVRSPRYYSAIDEVREPHAAASIERFRSPIHATGRANDAERYGVARDGIEAGHVPNPLGKLPGSVWTIASEPLRLPEHLGVQHYACVDEETEILTRDGWKRWTDHPMSNADWVGREVAGYNLDTGLAEWTRLHGLVSYQHDGPMVAVEKRDLSVRLTTNHRTLVQRGQTPATRQPIEVIEAGELGPQHSIPRSAEWAFESEPATKSIGANLAALCGWIAAEGWHQGPSTYLSQSLTANPAKVRRIDALLAGIETPTAVAHGERWRQLLPLVRTERQRVYRGQPWVEVVWRLPLGLSQRLRRLMPHKRLTAELANLPEDERRDLLDAFIDGDGHRRPDGRVGIFQKERENLDWLQMIAVTLGYKTTLRRGSDKWVLYLTTGGRSITLRGTNGTNDLIPREHYRGIVWCPMTGTGTFIARRNGSVFITGNSFPSEWPRRLILGWSPPGICLDCGQGRVPVVERGEKVLRRPESTKRGRPKPWARQIREETTGLGYHTADAAILGYACSCTPYTDHPGTGESSGPDGRYGDAIAAGAPYNPGGGLMNRPKVGPWREYHLDGWKPPPTRPAVVLDPFSGVGTTVGVARQLGRIGIGVDLSHPYCRAAKWRVFDSGSFTKAQARTWADRQGVLL